MLPNNRIGAIRGPNGATLDDLLVAMVDNGSRLDLLLGQSTQANSYLLEIRNLLQEISLTLANDAILQGDISNTINTTLPFILNSVSALEDAAFTNPDPVTGVRFPRLTSIVTLLEDIIECVCDGGTNPPPTVTLCSEQGLTLFGSSSDWQFVGNDTYNGEPVQVWRNSIQGLSNLPIALAQYAPGPTPLLVFAPQVTAPDTVEFCCEIDWSGSFPQESLGLRAVLLYQTRDSTGQDTAINLGGTPQPLANGRSSVSVSLLGEDGATFDFDTAVINFVFAGFAETSPPVANVAYYYTPILS